MKVRYYGHLGKPTGYGDAAGEFCMSMLEAGIDLEISTDATQCPNRFLPLAPFIRDVNQDSADVDAVIVHTLPLSCKNVLGAIDHLCKGAPRIAYTTWEGISPISQAVADALGAFDALWVPSRQTHRAVIHGPSPEPGLVEIIPHAYDPLAYGPNGLHHSGLDPSRAGSTYRFYYIGAWNRRKNVDGLIQAYIRAFSADDDVNLHMHSTGASREACKLAAISTGVEPGRMPAISFSSERVSDEEISALHQDSHCFVTATRGEAWNLPAFDAMLAKRHVIVPMGQGSDDFLANTSADRYRCELRPAGGEIRMVSMEAPGQPPGTGIAQYIGAQGMSVHDDWHDPDPSQLAIAMRRAYLDRVTDLRLDYNPADRFSRKVVGKMIRNTIESMKRKST